MKTHQLKTVQPYFDDVLSGSKTFEVRINDRDYRVGDRLSLFEYDDAQGYSGEQILVEVTYVLPGGNFGIDSGFCVMGIKRLPPTPPKVDPEDLSQVTFNV